ncbi:DNA helicase [Trifolium repens]|nr:DNA helicase [Trifolium repens]
MKCGEKKVVKLLHSGKESVAPSLHMVAITFAFKAQAWVKPAEGNSVSPLLYAIPHPSELFATDYDTNYLVDLMGRLHGVGAEKTYERNGVQSKMVVIELDNDGYRFKCTLFGEFVDVLNAFIASGETQNVIVMLMLAKVKKFQGRATVQNTLCASKLLFNPEYTIAVDLRKRTTMDRMEI